jgi:hypothetical protein
MCIGLTAPCMHIKADTWRAWPIGHHYEGSGLVVVWPICRTAVSPTSMTHIPPSIHQSPTETTPSPLFSLPEDLPLPSPSPSRAWLVQARQSVRAPLVAARKHRKVHREQMTSTELDVHLESLRWRSVYRSEEGVGRVDELSQRN